MPGEDCQASFEKSHIKGAEFFDLGIVRDMTSPYPHTMPSQAFVTKMLLTYRVKKSQTVVFYESGKGWFATRGAMVLRSYGHQNVYVLDGGLSKWT